MDYAIETLLKEYHLIRECLSEWDLKHYQEAREVRRRKLNQLSKALTKLGHDKHISQGERGAIK